MIANSATCAPENASHEAPGTRQPLLPFASDELLHVRIRPVDFARLMRTDKSTVSRWIGKGHITLGADGRLDPQLAMRQLLRNSDPGRIRTRLVRQAYGDLADLRSAAARADQLDQQLAEVRAQASAQRAADDEDYQRLSDWLDTFERCIGGIPQETRAALDSLAWRSHVKSQLLNIMDAEEDFAEIDKEIAAALAPVRAPAAGEGGGGA